MKKKIFIPFSMAVMSAAFIATAVPVYANEVNEDAFSFVDDVSTEVSYESSNDFVFDDTDYAEPDDEEIKEGEAVVVEDRFEDNEDQDVVINDVELIVLPRLVRDGYTHLYWSNTPDDTGDRYDIGSEYEIGKDSDIYAIWSENEFVYNLDTVEFESEGKTYNTPQTITVKGTDEGKFENNVFVGTVEEFDASAAANAISVSFNNIKDDEEYVIEVAEVEGGDLNENIITPTDKTLKVKYNVSVERTDPETEVKETIVTSSVTVNYDVNIEEVKEEIEEIEETSVSDNSVSDNKVKKQIESQPEDKKQEKINSFIPVFEGAEGTLDALKIKEMTEVESIAPEIAGYEYDHAEINGNRVVMLDKNEYYDEDWQKITEDTEIILFYRKNK